MALAEDDETRKLFSENESDDENGWMQSFREEEESNDLLD